MSSLVPLKDTTKSRDLYEAVKSTLNRLSLSIWNLSGITTDVHQRWWVKRWIYKIIGKRCNYLWKFTYDEISFHDTPRKVMH